MWVAVAATAISALGTLKQGREANAAAQYNSQIQQRNASIAMNQAGADAEAQNRHARQVLGAARAGYGASGVTLEGSPLDVLEMSATNAELDRQNILYKGRVRAAGYQSAAGLSEFEGNQAQDASYIRASSVLLNGGSRIYSSSKAGSSIATYGDQEEGY